MQNNENKIDHVSVKILYKNNPQNKGNRIICSSNYFFLLPKHYKFHLKEKH